MSVMRSSALLLFSGEVGERCALAEIDAQSATGADMGEGYFEGIGRLLDLGGFHGSTGDVLLLVIGGAGGDIFIHGEGPVAARGNGIESVGADGNHRGAERQLRLGEQGHGDAAGGERLAVGNPFLLGGNCDVADVDLAAVVEIAGGGGSGGAGLRCEKRGQENRYEYSSPDESGVHGWGSLRRKV